MGKRSRDDDSYDRIERKIRRLEKKLREKDKKSPIYYRNDEDRDYDSFHASSYNYQDEVELDAYPVNYASSEEDLHAPEFETVHTEATIHTQRVSTSEEIVAESSEPVQGLKSVVIEVPRQEPTQAMPDEDVVPDEIMEVLGEAKKLEETFGKKIPQGVSERLGKILIGGLAKDQKEALLNKSLFPENFQLAKAPKLNAEVTSILSEPAKNRDKRLEKLQNQLGAGISGLVNLTTDLINKNLEKMEVIKKISEVNQILLDLHYEETQSRRRLIIPMLDKNFINIVQNVTY